MLQVKNLPDETHAALAERARSEGTTMSEYVTRLIRRDLARPTLGQWIAEQRGMSPTIDIDVPATLDQVRADYDPAPGPGTPRGEARAGSR